MEQKGILLQGGRIVDPRNGLDRLGDLLIRDGQIAAILGEGQAMDDLDGLTKIPVPGKWVVPGLIDMHVHLREPGQEYKETIASGARAAAAGGFTAVACMPNTMPVNDSQTVTRFILERAAQAQARVYPVGAISKGGTGETLAEFGDLKGAGVVAVSDDGRPVANSQLMRRALEYARDFNLPVISHPEDLALSRNGVMNEGYLATKLGLMGIPSAAEEVMVYRDLALANHCGGRLHLAHISTREAIALIRRAKEGGLKVTAETAPHYFTLTEEAVGEYSTRAKMNPPLRTEDDRLAVQEGLRDGTLDAIATDHAPHSDLEKDVEFDLAANGIIGLETAVPLALELVRQGIISVTRFVQLLSVNPAGILGVAGGSLHLGAVADVTVIDPDKEFVYNRDGIVSKSKNSPFVGWQLKGKAVLTIMGGRITFQDS